MINSLFSPLIDFYDQQLLAAGVQQRLGLAAVGAPFCLGWTIAAQAGVTIEVLPLDAIHAVISGNKWFKLQYNLLFALQQGKTHLASCGGAHSNHLHALAWAGKTLGFSASAVVRGEEWANAETPTLRDVREWGMQLHCISRQQFRQWRDERWSGLQTAETLLLPEGGDNFLGVLGCIAMARLVPLQRYAQVHVACGTGCTWLGLRLGLPASVEVVGHSMLKGAWQRAELQARLASWSNGARPGPWRLEQQQKQRFAQTDNVLLDFMEAFTAETGVMLDPVYTGPLFWRLATLLQSGVVERGQRWLVIHSGGLQGRER